MAPVPTTVDLPADDGLRAARRSHRVRIACLMVLAIVVGLGVFGVLGVRTATEVARGGDGRELSVTYPRVARGGLAIKFEIVVTEPGGLDAPVEVEVSGHWLEMFDENGLDPDPESATADDETVMWTFEPPEGDVLTISFDARVEPAVQWGRDGHVLVRFPDGEPLAVSFHTWVLP